MNNDDNNNLLIFLILFLFCLFPINCLTIVSNSIITSHYAQDE